MAIDADTAADFAALGVTVETDVEEDSCEVWDVNWPSVLLFLKLETQWRCVALGITGAMQWLGLDYAALPTVFNLRAKSERRERPNADVFEDLRIMERAALPIINEPATE